MKRLCRLLSCAALLLSASFARADDVRLSFPLGNYYRPNRYVPVHVLAAFENAPQGELRLRATNAMQTGIEFTNGRCDAVVPWLLLGAPRDANYKLDDRKSGAISAPALQQVADDQFLVAYVGPNPPSRELLEALFPGKTPILIGRDATDPLPGPPIAWEMLDLFVVDGADADLLGPARIAGFLAAGTTIALRTESAPGSPWPFETVAGYQVLRHRLAGPRDSVSNANAYAPIAGWNADWPLALRQRILYFGLVFSIVAVGLCLLPRRLAVSGVVLLSAATFVVLLTQWWPRQEHALQRSGEVLVNNGRLCQRDTWIYQQSASRVRRGTAFVSAMRPMLKSPGYLNDFDLTLMCNERGEPTQFVYQMPPQMPLAFLSRNIERLSPSANVSPTNQSPMSQMNRLYLREDWSIVGQVPPADSENLGTLVIEIKSRGHKGAVTSPTAP